MRVQGSIRKVGPGSSGDRTLGHIATTVTLFVPHQSPLQGKLGLALWRVREEGRVLAARQTTSPLLWRGFDHSIDFARGCNSSTFRARNWRHSSLPYGFVSPSRPLRCSCPSAFCGAGVTPMPTPYVILLMKIPLLTPPSESRQGLLGTHSLLPNSVLKSALLRPWVMEGARLC